MTSHELVTRAIEFGGPERLPFFQHERPDVPDDVCDTWEMDRAKNGWFFDHAAEDDWGCKWATTELKNMGQVAAHPLEDWGRLATYRPPNPRDPFYFERMERELAQAGDRYVVVTSHFNLIERLHMLHGFIRTLEDLYLEPEKTEKVLDIILEHKLTLFHELHRRFGDRVHGLFLTDDWGTQKGTFIGVDLFRHFFLDRYRTLVEAVHGLGYHVILHSCGRINDFVPFFIEIGVDVMNMQQPRAYGIEEIGRRFGGKICFLTTVDIQSTLPRGDVQAVRDEAQTLVKHWSTPEGGLIVFNYGDPQSIAVRPEMTQVMFYAFRDIMTYWSDAKE